MSEEVTPYDRLAVPLRISEETVALALLRIADTICMHQETRSYIERHWAYDKQWAEDNDGKFRRDRLAEYNGLKIRIATLRTALRTMLAAMMETGDIALDKRHYLLDAAVENAITAAAVERQRARETEQPQWYRD